ncbi:N-acetylmuramoyl-L-alanine amidase [Sediminibacillus albus]|uniref:N-acetylmuramoyl-L-alanine amidase n=1 Tax=Sediminibacillus albus TaxID=407036 RepID=A0A1G8WPB9_9BACI|nr:N-acetylmuramoyl-L-alanine amidase [Sediminibacillus albus]SDJ80252.1 N-acetylmuramoyl-L-alanine amidase [Sediminibacillus albus]
MKLLYSLISCIAILALCLSWTGPAFAADSETYIVDASSLLVRSEPSSNGEVIGQLNNGDKVTVFDNAYGWAKTYVDDQEAWVASQYLYPEEDNGNLSTLHKEKETVTVDENSVRVRTGPGRNYSVYQTADKGESFELAATDKDWNRVVLPDGNDGWIYSRLTDKKEESATVQPLDGYTIVLDAGHGGKDPGAIGVNNVYEKDLTLNTVKKVQNSLEDSGANVILTRADDSYLSLENRIAISNQEETDAFISFHFNSFSLSSVGGIHTFHYTDGEDRKLAQSIQTGLSDRVSLEDKGTLQADYRVLKKNRDLSVLVELGFLSNPEELATIQSEKYQNNVAAGISEGVQRYFNLQD